MFSTIYTITNKQGNSFTLNDRSTDPLNFIALQAYPQFDIDIKNNEIVKEGQHGIWDFYSFYGRRSITFSGVIIGDTEVETEAQKDLMQTILGFPTQPTALNDGQVTLAWTDVQGDSWVIECKLSNTIQFNRPIGNPTLLNFTFLLKAADPFILGNTLYTIAGTRGWANAGSIFPILLPASIGIVYNNSRVVTNLGSVDAQSVIRIFGELPGLVTNPRVRNITTGKALFLNTVLADDTEWIEIDSKNGTIVNQAGLDLSGLIIGDSEFIVLVPGENEIVYESDEDPGITLYQPEASFTIKYRDTKI